jgi:hypothetical protein
MVKIIVAVVDRHAVVEEEKVKRALEVFGAQYLFAGGDDVIIDCTYDAYDVQTGLNDS